MPLPSTNWLADHRTEPLGRDHDHIDFVRRNNRSIMNRQNRGQRAASDPVGDGARSRSHRFRPFSCRAEQERQRRPGARPRLLSLGEVHPGAPRRASGSWGRPTTDRDAAVAQVQGVSPTLRAIAKHRAGLVEERPEIDVLISENSRRHKPRLGAADRNDADSDCQCARLSGGALICERRGGAADGFEAGDLGDGVLRLGLPPHFFQDIREQRHIAGARPAGARPLAFASP